MMCNKQWAQNCLRHNRNTAIIMLASLQLLNSNTVLNLQGKVILIKEDELIFNPESQDFLLYKYGVDLGQIAKDYTYERAKFLDSLEEFYRAIRRALIKESFEVVKAFAEHNNLLADLKNCPWYQFARIIRNAISHDFHFRFNKYDLTLLPIMWHNVTILPAMSDQPLSGNVLTHSIPWDLYSEMVDFVKHH